MAKINLNHSEAVKIITAFAGQTPVNISEDSLTVEFAGKSFSLDQLSITGKLKTEKIDFEVSVQSEDNEIEVLLK